MSFIDGLRHRLSVLLRGNAYDDEVRREMRFHRELEGDPSNAFGNETYYREEVRRMTLLSALDRFRQDATYATRGVRRSPGLAIAIALTLGFGIGATAAMLSLIDRILFQPAPGVVEPEQVRRIYTESTNPETGRLVWPTTQFQRFSAFSEAVNGRVAIAGFTTPDSVDIRNADARYSARRSFVTARYFDVLGVTARRGRLFADDEHDIAVPTRVAVVSDAFAARAFTDPASALGKVVKIGGDQYTIVGVAAEDFTGIDLDAVDIWLPENTFPARPDLPGMPWYTLDASAWNMIARPANAAIENDLLVAGSNAIRPVKIPGYAYDSTTRLRSGPIVLAAGPMAQTNDLKVTIRITWIAAIVLLIAWANVLNLLLLRASQRARDVAIRRALGVSGRRLTQQLTLEALGLAVGGAALAIVVAFWVGTAIRHLVLPRVHWSGPVVDARILAFIMGSTLIIAVIGGLAPALQALGLDLTNSLRAGAHSTTASRGARVRQALLVCQIALCVLLVVGAGLFVRSLQNVQSIGVGYATTDRIFLRPGFDDPAAHGMELRTAFPEAARQLATNRAIVSIAYSATPPLQGAAYMTILVPGRDSLPRLLGDIGPSFNSVSPNFFKTMGLAIREGRDFSTADVAGSAKVAIITESMARNYWPGESAVGKCFTLLKRENPCVTIVGVVADAHRYMMIEAPVQQFFLPLAQTTSTARDLIIHTRPGAQATVIRDADRVFRSLVTNMLEIRARTIDSVLEPQLRQWRLGVQMIGTLAALALLVSAIGVYSIAAYSASQRTKEIGVRIALGARRSDILDLIVGDGMRTVAIGLSVGVLGALAGGRLIATLLFGVTPNDAGVLVFALSVLGAVGIVGSIIPAFRVAGIDPMRSLRSD